MASVVWPEGAMSASAGPSEGTSRAARPSPRRSCSSGCATWRSRAVSSGPSAHTVVGGHEQARVVDRLECELDPPFVDALGPGLRTPAPALLDDSSAPPGRSSSSSAGGTIRKQVRTGSANVSPWPARRRGFRRARRARRRHASTDPSGETSAASHASTGPPVLGRRRRSAGGRSAANRRANASVKPHMRERRASSGAPLGLDRLPIRERGPGPRPGTMREAPTPVPRSDHGRHGR